MLVAARRAIPILPIGDGQKGIPRDQPDRHRLRTARLSNLFNHKTVAHTPFSLNLDSKILPISNTEYAVGCECSISSEYESTILAPGWVIARVGSSKYPRVAWWLPRQMAVQRPPEMQQAGQER